MRLFVSRNFYVVPAAMLFAATLPTLAQTTAPKPDAPKPAAAKRASAARSATSLWSADSVVSLLKAGLGEDLISDQIRKHDQPLPLTPSDLVNLKTAGASDNLIRLIMDPRTTPPAAPAAASPVVAREITPPTTTVSTPVAVATVVPAVATASSPVAATSQKRTVSVEPFDYSTVKTSVQAIFGTEQNIGAGIRALLVRRLEKAGQFTVVERAKVDAIMREQDFGSSTRVRQGSNPRIGRIKGAQLMLMGDIVVFGRDDKRRNIKGIGGAWGVAVGGISNMFSEQKAVVGINFRLVDAETSEVLLTEEAKGESKRQSRSWGGFLAGGAGFGGASVDMTSSNFADTIIGEATMDAVDKLAAAMTERAKQVPARQLSVDGLVAAVNGSSLTLNVGSADGVQAGDRFEVSRVTGEVTDPVTKEVLDRVVERAGVLVIGSVRERTATGTYTGTPAQVGFVARKD